MRATARFDTAAASTATPMSRTAYTKRWLWLLIWSRAADNLPSTGNLEAEIKSEVVCGGRNRNGLSIPSCLSHEATSGRCLDSKLSRSDDIVLETAFESLTWDAI